MGWLSRRLRLPAAGLVSLLCLMTKMIVSSSQWASGVDAYGFSRRPMTTCRNAACSAGRPTLCLSTATTTTTTTTTTRRRRRSASSALHLGDFFKGFGGGGGDGNVSSDADPPTDNVDGAYDAEDPVEGLFSFFFGKREATPFGLTRFGPNRFPEQYPATTTEFADPLASDDATMAVIRPFLKNTNFEQRSLRLTYDANRDGWSPTAFHSRVDKQGPAVVLATTRRGMTVGGYNPKGWVGYGESRASIAAFLFVVGRPYAAAENAPGLKLQKVGGPSLAQMDLPETGPCFGADALVMELDANDPKAARSKLGSYYAKWPDGTNSLFGKDAAVQLQDLKVYHGVYQEGEYIPFTDAEPLALY